MTCHLNLGKGLLCALPPFDCLAHLDWELSQTGRPLHVYICSSSPKVVQPLSESVEATDITH